MRPGQFVAFLSIFTAAGLAAGGNTAVEPVPRDQQVWMNRHELITKTVQEINPRLVFIGDSITHFWEVTGKDTWHAEYDRYRVANLGIASDRTQHVLWRLEHGNLDTNSPELAIIQIGTNNITPDPQGGFEPDSPEEIAEGVLAIVQQVRDRVPKAQILLLGLFPRADIPLDRAAVVQQVNDILAHVPFDEHTRYRDIGQVFLEPDGSLSTEVMWDHLHPAKEGYKRWADAIRDDVVAVLGR